MSGSRPSAGQASALMALIYPQKLGHILQGKDSRAPLRLLSEGKKDTYPGRAYKLERHVNFWDKRDA